MATLVPYKGLQVLSDTPGPGGAAIQDDLKQLVDWSPRTEWAKTSPPGTGDNASQDFYPGSLWLQTNTSPPKLFVCQSSTTSSAVWQQVMTEIKIVNDTAPQLGGNLDVNGKAITSASGSLVLNPNNGQVYIGSTQSSLVRGAHLNIEKNSPAIVLYDKTSSPTPPPTDEKAWDFSATASKLFFRLLNDTVTAATIWLEVQRTGTSVLMIRFTGLVRMAGPLHTSQTYCDNLTPDDANTITFNLANSDMHRVVLGSSAGFSNPRTLALANVHIGQRFNVTICQAIGNASAQTVNWWSGISWPGNVVPTLTTTAGKKDAFEFLCTDTSPQKFMGRVWGQNYDI